MFDNIRLLKLDPREYFDDILGLILTGLGTNALIITLFSIWLPKFQILIPNLRNLVPHSYDYFPLSIGYIKIAVWLITYLYIRKWLLLRVRPSIHKITGRRILGNTFSLNLSRFDQEWEFQGNIKIINKGLVISNTPSGCIIKNSFWDTKIWDDFSATFQVSFKNYFSLENDFVQPKDPRYIRHVLMAKKVQFRQLLGIIFRAQNLDDHFMLGIMIVGNYLIFRPHVRVAGNLDIPLHNSPNSIFAFQRRNKEFQFKLLVSKNEVKLYLRQGREWQRCYYWLIPSFYKTNLNEAQSDPNISGIITRKIPFKNAPGLFGFRNYGNELAIINSLNIHNKFTKEEVNLFKK